MKKVKWIVLALVLCLGLIGGAYAYWENELYMEGTISSGNWDVRFDNFVMDENSIAGLSHVFYSDHIAITVTNAYPRLKVTGSVDIFNDGSVPATITLQANRLDDDANGLPYDGPVYLDADGHNTTIEPGERETIEFEFGVGPTVVDTGFDTIRFVLAHSAQSPN